MLRKNYKSQHFSVKITENVPYLRHKIAALRNFIHYERIPVLTKMPFAQNQKWFTQNYYKK